MPLFSVEKSIEIAAPRDQVYASVRDFRQWPEWSPWLIAEPECGLVYADDGKSYTWDGKIIGAGELAIVDESPPGRIDYRLSFFRPFKSINKSSFLFSEQGSGTKVTWTMEGSLPFFLFFMKKMMTAFVGMDYERGLSMLKDKLESGTVPSALVFPGVQAVSGFSFVGIRTQCPISEIGPAMERDLQKVGTWLQGNGTKPSGPPFTIYHKWDMANARTDYTTGFPLTSVPANVPAEYSTGEMSSGQSYQIRHTGPYRHLGNAWSAGYMHARARPKIFAQDKRILPFEIYENDPSEVPENDLITVVHFPAK